MKIMATLARVDWILILTVLALSAFGLVILAGITASSPAEAMESELVRRQALWVGIGFAILALAAIVDYRWLRHLSVVAYVATLGLLGAVLRFGVAAGGAQRWLVLGTQSIQPSEFAKIVVIVTLAHQLARKNDGEDDEPRSWLDLLWAAIHVGVPAVLVLAQPDLGTALVFGAILFCELYMVGFSPWRLLAVLGSGAAATWGALVANLRFGIDVPFLRPHMVNRLVSFIDPAADPTGAGYQLQQSIIAIGSGRLTGNGLFRGSSAPLSYLPEQQTDFVFSALAEQTGFVGTSLLLILFLVMFLRMLTAAANTEDEFGAAIVSGAVGLLFFHVLVNVGMTVGLMPVTGLPLPFISYGRSAFIADMVAVGLVINVGLRGERTPVAGMRRSYVGK